MIFDSLIRIFLISADLNLSVFVLLCHWMLFYGAYVEEVGGKATRECGCCMTNVGVRCYVILRETLLKWTRKSILYISLNKMSFREFVLL